MAGGSTLQIIVGIGGAMLLSGIVGGITAVYKNRDISHWIAWSFLFPPSVIVLLLLPAHKGARPRRQTLDEEDRASEDF